MDIPELRDQLERHHRESYGWALSCCSRHPEEAEDVLQTVYVKILEGKARYGARAAFKTWLFSVIRNTAAEGRRRNALRRLKLLTHGAAAVARSHAGLAEPLDRSLVRSAFQTALATVPKRQRQVLFLVFYHDLSLKEAADVLGVSIGTVRAHYERGKKRLRERMEGSSEDEWRPERRGHQGALPRPAADG